MHGDTSFANTMERTFHTEAGLRAFAADFARTLRAGDVVGLSGALGSGKTAFVRAVVEARLGRDLTSSPTFTFWHRYTGTPADVPIDHLDLYRVEDPADLLELGLDEVFDGTSIVLVEWWRNAPALLPQARVEIEIAGCADEPRRVRVSRPV